MRAIKALTVLAVVATAGWCSYWFIGVRALDRAITAGLAHVPEVSAEAHHIQGFPNRFDVTLDHPRIAVDGIEWTAPFVQLFALTYRLNHLVAVFAPDQGFSLNGTRATLHSGDLRASLEMEPGLDLPVERFTLVGRDLDLQVAQGTHSFDTLRFATRRTVGGAHQLALLAENVFPDPELMAQLDPDGLWPRRFDTLRADAELEFDRPVDRHLFDGPEPRLTRVTLTGGRIKSPEFDISATGRLTPGEDGTLSGDVTLTITGWRLLLDRARDAGRLTPDYHGLLTETLAAMAVGESGDTIEAPLSVLNGDVHIGPLLLGTLPRF